MASATSTIRHLPTGFYLVFVGLYCCANATIYTSSLCKPDLAINLTWLLFLRLLRACKKANSDEGKELRGKVGFLLAGVNFIGRLFEFINKHVWEHKVEQHVKERERERERHWVNNWFGLPACFQQQQLFSGTAVHFGFLTFMQSPS